MIVTASPRLPPSSAWSFNRTGHVAMTINAAQISGMRKGRMIQKVDSDEYPDEKHLPGSHGQHRWKRGSSPFIFKLLYASVLHLSLDKTTRAADTDLKTPVVVASIITWC
ncbi:MAG: hypothetical protein MZU91_02530 [Desulfosudis oleivorans]|nr:hypothetical protein [Desulfosudis oleivorans]